MKGVQLIDKKDLEVGSLYEVEGLLFDVAIWTGSTFRGPATEYKTINFREEDHYSDGLPNGTCKPVRKLSNIVLRYPFDGMNLLSLMKILNDEIVDRKNCDNQIYN